MGKVKPKVKTEEEQEFGVINKTIRKQKLHQKWNHIFKKIYVRNNGTNKMSSSNNNNGENKVDEVSSPPAATPVENNENNTKLNGKRIITDPIPSTSTGITANGRGKRKWEEIPRNGYYKRKVGRYGMMNGFNGAAPYDPDSSLDGCSSDLEAVNGEFDLSSDIHYDDSSDDSENGEYNMSELMAMHEMENSDYDDEGDEEEFCSEEESLDEEYSVGDESQSYDSNEIESEYFSDSEEEDYESSEPEDPEDYHAYEGSSSDTDYDPGDNYIEDLYVARGTAVTYSAKEITNQLPFTEDTDEPQIIDITDMLEAKDDDDDDESGDSCPKLVPIKGQKKLNGQNTTVSSDTSSTSSNDDSNPGPSILLDNEFTSSSSDDSVISVVESSSEEEIDEKYSNIDTKDHFHISNSLNNNSPSCLLHLKRPVYVNGVVDVELLAGNAQIFGYNLPKKGSEKDTVAQIISARGYKLINITPVESSGGQETIKVIIDSLKDQFASEDLEIIKNNFEKSHALLLLSRSKLNSRIKIVKKYTSGRYLFPEAMTIGQRNHHYLSEVLLNTKIYTESSCKRPLRLPDQWDKVTPQPNSRTLIIGGKNVGKSTFAEYLINKSLAHSNNHQVLLIDLDIGQPILFVPQVVSATVVKKPILGNGILGECGTLLKSFIFGDVNVMLSPVKYVKCVKALLEYCLTDKTLSTMPWIINTMGFQKGLGVELMAAIIKMSNPTQVIQIQHEIENFNFRNVMNASFVNDFTFNMFKEEIEDCKFGIPSEKMRYETMEMQSVMNEMPIETTKKQEEPSLLPVEKRTVMMLAHLSNVTGDYEWITDQTPFVITDPQISIASSEKIPKTRELEAINGNIIYLCHSPSLTTSCDKNQPSYECFGIGLIRAIDIKNNLAYVHHSIPRTKMSEVNLLVLANVTPPKDIFLKQSNKVIGPLPNLYNTEAEFAGSRKITRGNHHVLKH